MKNRQYRQGDVLVHPIEKIPNGAEKFNGKTIVLAEGEATGHAHRIAASPKVEAYFKDGVLYLNVLEETDLTHEEHGTITLDPGAYEVKRQIETWRDEVRYVAD